MSHYRTKCEVEECPCFGFPCKPNTHPEELHESEKSTGMIELESIESTERDGHTHLLFTLGHVTVEMSEGEVVKLEQKLYGWLNHGEVLGK